MSKQTYNAAVAATDQLLAADREFVRQNYEAAGVLCLRLAAALADGDAMVPLSSAECGIIIRLATHHLSALLLDVEPQSAP